jgi:glucose/arabinose dehydrogenase
VVASGLNSPNSVSVAGSQLLIAEANHISVAALDGDGVQGKSLPTLLTLPTGGNHTSRTVLAAPDGYLYVSAGSTCNVCRETDPRRAAVWRYDADGTGGELYSAGLRNAVGLAVNPWNGEIWATNNGRDGMGDETPPETVDVLTEGADFGWPRCHAGNIPDPQFGGSGDTACASVKGPEVTLPAHVAPLGLAFYKDGPFPAPYNNSLYVAEHGSWNSSTKVGYKVIRVPMAPDGRAAGKPVDFATGFLRSDDTAYGRPAGVAVAPDGSLLISDDKGGFIYRVAWAGSGQ